MIKRINNTTIKTKVLPFPYPPLPYPYPPYPQPISAKVVDRNEKGLIIKGARLLATKGGLTDEVLVISAPRLFFDSDEAFAFFIPSNTKGLKFICRESFVGGASFFNHPSAQDMKKWIQLLSLTMY